MFKRHVYTCPDVIYLRNRQRNITLATYGVGLVIYGGLFAYGWLLERKATKDIEELHQES